MSDKKQKEAGIKKVKQVLVVGACVLFVVLMILSGMGSHWLTMFTVVKPGDTVVIDYTFYDASGSPILTSNQQTAAKGNILYANQRLSMIAGQNLSKEIYPVPIYTGSSDPTNQFALFFREYSAINLAVIGMKSGEQKRVDIPNSSIAQRWTAETIASSGVNINELNVGDVLPMAVSDKPAEMVTNTTITYLRAGEIVSKTNESIVVDSGYPAVDISIYSINANS
ncbi:MAG TPA: hypothetical protein P5013_04540 [Methanoregula sp.]|nr:hypothetical protein [Methanoregula sp.]